jgi:hypothetical protein
LYSKIRIIEVLEYEIQQILREIDINAKYFPFLTGNLINSLIPLRH